MRNNTGKGNLLERKRAVWDAYNHIVDMAKTTDTDQFSFLLFDPMILPSFNLYVGNQNATSEG